MERLYDDLAAWWPRLSPPEDYDEEAVVYLSLLHNASPGGLGSLLELGSGAGHLACHVPEEVEVVLVDLSPSMLQVSRGLNPHREHIQGDMRELRLGRTFDAVLLHDAVMYMTSEEDLRAALRTVRAHLAPGGVTLVCPDFLLETLEPGSSSVCGTDEARLLEWRHEPVGTTVRVDFALLLKEEDGQVRCAHDVHTQGVFPHATWLRLFDEAGLTLLPLDDDFVNVVFLLRAR